MSVNKKIAITAMLLMLFALIGTALVAITNENTKEDIIKNEKLSLLRKLNTILPADLYDNDLVNDTITLMPDYLLGTDQESVAYIARKNNNPVAVVLSVTAPNGYNGPIDLLIGINSDGTLAGTRIVKHRETPGLGDAIEVKKSDWILGFDNRSLTDPTQNYWKVKRDGGTFDQFTGATITPRAVIKAVHSTLIYFEKNKSKLFVKKDIKADTPTVNEPAPNQ